ncbi:hypothetical protein FACS189440_01180 [Bacteroidia bacterium]|nr:hypothetical protein FACS189423_11850 [Bacteroidia bacterium]GHT45348.1 hypothetical protein FACS189440_01180 [Bacteroidia bacterium]
MKKVILFVVISLAISSVAAQNNGEQAGKHELSAGVGVFSFNQALSALGDLLGTAATAGYVTTAGDYNWFTPFISYQYAFSKRFSLGGTFAFDYNTLKVSNHDTPVGNYKRYYSTFSLEGVLNYMNNGNSRLYGLLGGGVTVTSIPDNKEKINNLVYPNFQISPIGYKFGDKIGGFVELGYGYKGFINAGVFTRF